MLFAILMGVAGESFLLLQRMAPYLLFGFLFAGVLHIFLSPEKVASHLGKRNFASVIKSSLFGVPLPLCSCGVVPAAFSLRREGASVGAVLAFLISTPTTGIDSIFATYSLMGGLFTVYRIIASFGTGVLAGVLANIFVREEEKEAHVERQCPHCVAGAVAARPLLGKAIEAVRYGFVDLFDDVAKWLLVGVVAGGVISFFTPEGFFAGLLGTGWLSYAAMSLIGVPMYVCATGSIPIAASLMLKGLSPGAAFAFLVSGPATNMATITVVMQKLGARAAAIYLGSIFAASVGLGYILDRVWPRFYPRGAHTHAAMHGPALPSAIENISAYVLLALVIVSVVRNIRRRRGSQ